MKFKIKDFNHYLYILLNINMIIRDRFFYKVEYENLLKLVEIP